MSIWVTMVTSTVLAATKFRNFLCSHYNVISPSLQNNCDGCLQTFLVRHVPNCRNVGLVITHHNEIRDEIVHLAIQDFSLHFIHGKPQIHLVRRRSEEEFRHGGRVPETRFDVSIRGLWEIQMKVIIDVRFGDADSENWNPEGMDNLLAW